MLKYLKIKNLAIIDAVEVEFRDGFNVLTGETGAGKSILIGALDLLLGGKVSADVIRTGEEEAHVEGLFDVPDSGVLEGCVDVETSAGEVLLSRRISRSGRSRCSINGSTATLAMLQNVGGRLVAIFGQHEHRVLLDTDEHLDILDRFRNLGEVRHATAQAFGEWNAAVRAVARAEQALRTMEDSAEDDRHTAKELQSLGLKEGEEERLIQERDIVKKASQIKEKACEAYQRLYSRSGSLMEGLAELRKPVEFLASANPAFQALNENFQDALYRLEDISLELRGICDKTHGDPRMLEQLEERLSSIRRLKKKYATDVPGLLKMMEAMAGEEEKLFEARSSLKKLSAVAEKLKEEYFRCAKKLSEARHRAADELTVAVGAELKELAMPDALFQVHFQELDTSRAGATGLEQVEFFLASNPGEAPRPLARIASGGELSRIMLALKALQMDKDPAGTVIFDEVDTGVGGLTALAVGTRLARVATRQQVLCVTHLHQIAAMADHHVSVSKSVAKGRTRIKVKPLSKEARVDELARMLGASPGSEPAREHVKRLMDTGRAEVSG